MKILFLGHKGGTSLQRAEALRRLGHEVLQVDVGESVGKGRLVRKLHWETGGLFAAKAHARAVLDAIPSKETFEFTWVDHGRYVGPGLVRTLRERYGPVANYNADNPFTLRDRLSWALYKRALPEYDAVGLVRRSNIAPAQAAGARKILVDYRTADEVQHRPRELTPEERARWTSEVVFAGTSMEDRAAFLVRLLELKVPLTLYGTGYDRTPEWPRLEPVWRGVGLTDPREYTAAMIGAEVALGFVSKGNEDLHTHRSLDIPAMGALFCGPRTLDHETLYEDGEEAVLWETPEECADACRRLLTDAPLRARIRQAGHARNLRNGYFNEPLGQKMIDAALGLETLLVPPVGPV